MPFDRDVKLQTDIVWPGPPLAALTPFNASAPALNINPGFGMENDERWRLAVGEVGLVGDGGSECLLDGRAGLCFMTDMEFGISICEGFLEVGTSVGFGGRVTRSEDRIWGSVERGVRFLRAPGMRVGIFGDASGVRRPFTHLLFRALWVLE